MDDKIHTVNLERQVDYTTLVDALCKAAKEVGFTALFQDDFSHDYKMEKGIVQRVENYHHTDVNINQNGYLVMSLYIGDKRVPIEYFQVTRECQHKITHKTTSREEIEKYLIAVSNNLFR